MGYSFQTLYLGRLYRSKMKMRLLRKAIRLAPVCLLCAQFVGAQNASYTPIPLNDLSAFKNPGTNWTVAADVWGDYTKQEDLEIIKKGTGAVLNTPTKDAHTHLVTNQEFGDVEIQLDFMMAKGSNSGVYLQGRYEVQLFDSWTKPNPTYADCGGIYQRWDDAKPGEDKGYEGIAPTSNAAKAPGLWQHLRIKFRAPRFDDNGQKTENARFEAVYLNGVLVQDQVAVTGPTRSAMFSDEKAMGPLMLQGDHGPVAFRNIGYRPLVEEARPKNQLGEMITVTPSNQPYLLRGFVKFGDRKLTHVISLGNPNQLNYTYDISQGSLVQVWHGGFMDATDMWHSRGEQQLAQPLGSVIPLSDAPSIAILPSSNAPWPDSVSFEDLKGSGYMLDKERIPTFRYMLKGAEVSDKTVPQPDGTAFSRTIKVVNPPDGMYCRFASATTIQAVDKGLYRGNGSYYIRIDKHIKPTIRQTQQGQEMLVPIDGTNPTITYSIIW